MSATLTRLRLAHGMWEGFLEAPSLPELRLRHRDQALPPPEAERDEAARGWRVRFRLPVERLSDGIETFVIEDAATGEALAHETIVAGEAAGAGLASEVALLRAELDMLKRAFRRHCRGD